MLELRMKLYELLERWPSRIIQAIWLALKTLTANCAMEEAPRQVDGTAAY